MKLKTLIAGAMIAGAALLAPSGASAALSDCPSNHMCMWANNDFKLKIGDRNHGSTAITNLGGDANDQMDSWANRSASWTGCMWEHANGMGDDQQMGRNENDDNVNVFNSDEVTSWRTANGC